MSDSILVLDDERTYAEMLGELLADNGYTAEIATDPREALERLHERSFGLIVSDFKMPEVDGAQFLTEARRIVPQLPVIMVSGLMTTPDLLKVANIGVTLVLEKPFKVDVFLEHVRRFVKPEGAGEIDEDAEGAAEGEGPGYPPLRYLVDDSAASQALVERLWEASQSEARHIILRLPPGGEFSACVREVSGWRGGGSAPPFHFPLAELGSPEARQRLLELAAEPAASPCVAVTLSEDSLFDPESFDAFMAWVESERVALDRFVFLHALPFGADIDGLRDAKQIRGPLTLEPLRNRLVDLAAYVERFLGTLPPESGVALDPAAVGVLLQYDWPGNHRELMAVLRRAFSQARGGEVRQEDIAAAIRSRHGELAEAGQALDLGAFLLIEQRRYLRAHVEPDADLKTLAEATGIGLDRLRAGRVPSEQPLLFPELLTEEDDYSENDDHGPGHQ